MHERGILYWKQQSRADASGARRRSVDAFCLSRCFSRAKGVFGEPLFLPLVRLKGVFQQQNSLCELVCLQAIRFYLSEATTSGETTKKLKSGWRGRIAAWPLETQAFRFLLFCLFYFFAAWPDVGSAEARSCFLDLSGVWLVARGIHVKLGQIDLVVFFLVFCLICWI